MKGWQYMAHAFSILWLAVAMSMDSLGTGTTYGMRGMRISLLSTMIIAGCSGVVLYLSMVLGHWLSVWLPVSVARGTGAAILIFLGLMALWQARKNVAGSQQPERVHEKEESFNRLPRVWTFRLNMLGLVIQIWKTPLAADVDRSGSISSTEAFLLGAALSLDSFGAGLGAALVGLPPVPSALMLAGMSALFLRIGMFVGFRFAGRRMHPWLVYLPGFLLMVMGMVRFF
jgi:putative sporulation protein YtaF